MYGGAVRNILRLSERSRENDPDLRSAQRTTLESLLRRASATSFGRVYGFPGILASADPVLAFREQVPVHSYTKLRDEWWSKCYAGEADITWPGRTPYFSMSSGTSDATSKNLPVTHDLIKSINTIGSRQVRALAGFGLPPSTFASNALMLGSSTSLVHRNGYLEGDISGISTRHLPWWMSALYLRPGRNITDLRSWPERIDAIVGEAHRWNVGTICGVPSWVTLLLDRLVAHYRLGNIHQLWPRFNLYIHGGVAFGNYAQAFNKLLGRPVTRMETYMASEGSFGYQAVPGRGIRLVADAGIFYEFIPFTRLTFNEAGECVDSSRCVTLEQVTEEVNYAIVISTCGGAWRYLLGDVVRFTDARAGEIMITGRTRQFLDVAGEHLSADNMVRALAETAAHHGFHPGEFTVTATKKGLLHGHHWYVGVGDPPSDVAGFTGMLDKCLCRLNDDYRVARQATIASVETTFVPHESFHGFLRASGRHEAMSKFPRVLKGDQLNDWQQYLAHGKSIVGV